MQKQWNLYAFFALRPLKKKQRIDSPKWLKTVREMRFSQYGSKRMNKGVPWEPGEFVWATIENTWENEGSLRIQQGETVASHGNPLAAHKLLDKQENRWENNVFSGV